MEEPKQPSPAVIEAIELSDHFFRQEYSKLLAVVSKYLKEYEEILSSNGFFRIHRSYVVNLNKVLKLEKAEGGVLHLQGNHQLPVSTRKREKLSMRLDML